MVISKVKVLFNEGVREFTVPRSVSMLKLEVISRTVTVEGRMTKDSAYTVISGVKADLTKTKAATQGITSFEVAGFYSVNQFTVRTF